MKQQGAMIGLVIILAALGFGMTAFKTSLVNYVPFADARRATDTSVQVMGAPVPGTLNYSTGEHALHFILSDEHGQTLPVIYHGPKPEDMDSASAKGTKIAVQGAFDPAQHQFVADKLLVKCPSKYNGTGGPQDRSYSSQ